MPKFKELKKTPFHVEERKGRKIPALRIAHRWDTRAKGDTYWGRVVAKNGEKLSTTEIETKITSVAKNFRAQAQAFGVPAGTFLKYYMVHEDAIYTDKVATK